MGVLDDNLKQIKLEMDALLIYTNQATGENDESLGESIRKLVDGFGKGESDGSGVLISGEYTPETNIRTMTIPELVDCDIVILTTKTSPFNINTTRKQVYNVVYDGKMRIVCSTNSDGSGSSVSLSYNYTTGENTSASFDKTTGTFSVKAGASANYGGYYYGGLTYIYFGVNKLKNQIVNTNKIPELTYTLRNISGTPQLSGINFPEAEHITIINNKTTFSGVSLSYCRCGTGDPYKPKCNKITVKLNNTLTASFADFFRDTLVATDIELIGFDTDTITGTWNRWFYALDITNYYFTVTGVPLSWVTGDGTNGAFTGSAQKVAVYFDGTLQHNATFNGLGNWTNETIDRFIDHMMDNANGLTLTLKNATTYSRFNTEERRAKIEAKGWVLTNA